MKTRALFFGSFLGLLIVDQVVKELTRRAFIEGQAHALWPGVFELTLTYNKGIAFGQLQGMGVMLAPVALLISGFATVHSWRHPKESPWIHFALGMLASGAIGNLIDRLWMGKVTDMFWFRAIDFPVFNVADACISLAAGILILAWGKESAKHPAKPATAVGEASTPGEWRQQVTAPNPSEADQLQTPKSSSEVEL